MTPSARRGIGHGQKSQETGVLSFDKTTITRRGYIGTVSGGKSRHGAKNEREGEMGVLVNYGEPYGMGWEAWMAGDTIADCPYRAGTESHGKWFRGWENARAHFIRRTNIDRFLAQPNPPATTPMQAG